MDWRIVIITAVLSVQRAIGLRGSWASNGTYEYYVSPAGESKSYKDAQTFCGENDGAMALVKTKEIQTFIESLVNNESGAPYGFYIGLRDVHGKGTFTWEDGSSIEYKYWNTGEPNKFGEEPCVVVGNVYTYSSEMKWNNIQCEQGSTGEKGFVCQRKIGKSWGSWSGCSCAQPTHIKMRTCIDSGRPGPESCNETSNDTAACPTYGPCTTVHPLDTTIDETTRMETTVTVTTKMKTTVLLGGKEETTTAVQTQHGAAGSTKAIAQVTSRKFDTTSSRADKDDNKSPSSLIPVVAGGGGFLLAVLLIIVIVLFRKNKARKNKALIASHSVELADITDGQPSGSGFINAEIEANHELPAENNSGGDAGYDTVENLERVGEKKDAAKEKSTALEDAAYDTLQNIDNGGIARTVEDGNYTEITVKKSQPDDAYCLLNRGGTFTQSPTYSSLQTSAGTSQNIDSGGYAGLVEDNTKMTGVKTQSDDAYCSLNREEAVTQSPMYSSVQKSVRQKAPHSSASVMASPYEDISDNSYDVLRGHEKPTQSSCPESVYSTAGSFVTNNEDKDSDGNSRTEPADSQNSDPEAASHVVHQSVGGEIYSVVVKK